VPECGSSKESDSVPQTENQTDVLFDSPAFVDPLAILKRVTAIRRSAAGRPGPGAIAPG
tara:strand:- start:69 stop:245 length:177 start_codon:yes stop_codon:yes gene_type:complete